MITPRMVLADAGTMMLRTGHWAAGVVLHVGLLIALYPPGPSTAFAFKAHRNVPRASSRPRSPSMMMTSATTELDQDQVRVSRSVGAKHGRPLHTHVRCPL
jgi:hypothetical protein